MNNKNLMYDLDGPWCIGSDDYLCLLSHVDKVSTKKILELGSGQSTFQLANDFQEAQLLSLENDSEIAINNQAFLETQSHFSAQIIYAPVNMQQYRGGAFITYDVSLLKDFADIDLLIVDGPVERLYPIGRQAALYLLFDKLSVGAIIGLDDYHRESAKEAVRNWLFVFNDSLKIKQESDSFVVLEKTAECKKPRINFSMLIYSYYYFFKAIYKISRRKIGLKLRKNA